MIISPCDLGRLNFFGEGRPLREAAAMEKPPVCGKVEPCYSFDEIVPLYSSGTTAGKKRRRRLYACAMSGGGQPVLDQDEATFMMRDAARQYFTSAVQSRLSVWLDDEYYNYDNFAAMREKEVRGPER